MSDEVSCVELLKRQNELIQEAGSVLPLKSDKCSITRKRQKVFACLSCSDLYKTPIGLCYSCHISCHTTHSIIPLDVKTFTCDCGVHDSCTLKTQKSTSHNIYNHNFRGKYCHCDSIYDQEDTMYQCLICEDWFHDYCLSQGALESSDEYVCSSCVTSNSILLGYAGNSSFVFSTPTLTKSLSTCPLKNTVTETSGKADLFLLEHWRNQICKCLKCLEILPKCLIVQEEIWEPELDPKAFVNPFELGMQQLLCMDRKMAIEGIYAYDKLKESLYTDLLIPCMERNETVTEDQIRAWFDEYISTSH